MAVDARDVDLDRSVASIMAKRDQPDRVLLGESIREHLKGYLDGRDSGPLFPSSRGGRLQRRQVGRRLAYWAGQARLRRTVTPHMLRHTFATRIYRKTGDVLLVKEALRHRSVVSTLVYARPQEEALRAVL